MRRAVVRRWFTLPADALVLVYSSRLTPDRQPLVFAETLALLRARGLDVYAIVTGDGSHQAALIRRLEELGITDRVRMLGAVDDRMLPDVVACGDVAFLPSEREGIALALLEGMACGLPFVGTANSSQAEVVTPDVGALVGRGSPEEEAQAYADALARILGDRTALASMGARARARIDDAWSFRRMGDQLETAIEASIAHAARRTPEDDLAALPRALAALSMHATTADVAASCTRHAQALEQVLAELGSDHAGRPLPGRAPRA